MGQMIKLTGYVYSINEICHHTNP